MLSAQEWARRLPSSAMAAGVVFLWGAYLCLWNIGSANQNADEGIYVEAGWDYVHGDFAANREHPPTAKYLFGVVQLIFGEGLLAPRIFVGLLTLAVGVVIWLWLRREIGFTLALIPAALWLLLPRGVAGGAERLDRFALLEPVMVAFTVFAMAAAWMWFRTERWPWIIASGVFMGLAITAKVSAVVILVGFLVLLVTRRPLARVLRDAALFVVALVVTAVALYLPMGMTDAVGYMLQTQAEHNAAGHLITVAGITGSFPPWWANLWFAVVGVGIPTAAVLTAGLVAAVGAGRPRRLVLFVGTALGALLVFHLFGSNVALPHYYYAWFWMLAVLAGLGLAGLLRPGPRSVLVVVGRVVGILALLLVVVIAARLSVYTWQERAAGMALVEDALEEDPAPDGDVLVAGMAPWEYEPYIDEDEIVGDPALVDTADIRAIVVKHSPRFGIDPRIQSFVDQAQPGVRLEQLDDTYVYILDARLVSAGDTLVLER
jgi:hypothetical protein